jgi:GT2 family glycosyltransferase
MATLTVAIPNFNHAAYVGEALAAVASQSRLPDEVIVLDDGSTDDSIAVIEPWQARVPVLRLIRHDVNRGILPSLQELVALAEGDYLYVGAADDHVMPGMVAAVMSMAERFPQAGIVFGDLVGIDARGRITRTYRGPGARAGYLSPAEFRAYCDHSPAHRSLSASTVFRRDCLLEVGGYRPELASWTDTFALRAVAMKHGACYVPQPLAAWRRLPQSFSRRSMRRLADSLQLADRAAALMRSAEFRDRFPEPHVRNWRRRFRRGVYLRHAKSLAAASLRKCLGRSD